MSRDRGPVLKRARALGIEPQYLGIIKNPKDRAQSDAAKRANTVSS